MKLTLLMDLRKVMIYIIEHLGMERLRLLMVMRLRFYLKMDRREGSLGRF
jgi:hypothetical protein